MLPATALALLMSRMCSTDVYCSKQTGSSSTKRGKPSPIISSFRNWAEENCRCSQNLYGAENVVKQKPINIRKWIARFCIFLGIYTLAGSACVLLTIIA